MDDEPLEMVRRLDFADWLEANGQGQRAAWFRQCCGICADVHPLTAGWANWNSLLRAGPFGALNLAQTALAGWTALRPDYWTDCEGVVQVPYFGRLILTPDTNNGEAIRRLGTVDWLPRAHQEGWLESICVRPFRPESLAAILEWPESHRSLPLVLDLTCARAGGGFMPRVVNEVLGFAGLRGLFLGPDVIGFSGVQNLAARAPELRYLVLMEMRAVGTIVRVLEQLKGLHGLRSLRVGRKHPDDSSLDAILAVPALQCLGLYGERITDSGLAKVGSLPSLRRLMVDLPGVTRKGVESLRKSRPDLVVEVQGDMRNRFGPA